ncbi:MAG: tRNA dihydrouridine synthase DusB, partial [Actinobacteria bacterium]|nr:tRNA dihydrouridine synthase DusB [Actinomycetota bacterium]
MTQSVAAASPAAVTRPLALRGTHTDGSPGRGVEVWPPVVLAPMAGVTNAPFRSLCRSFGPGLIYVNEMIMAAALVYGNTRTRSMVTFAPDEQFRSLQLYGSDPRTMESAVDILGRENLVDHIDLNFGCPAAKVTRKGGGAAVPLKKNLLREIVASTVRAASRYGIPVTCKFRMGVTDDLLTYLDTGAICRDEGAVAIALHARTAEQHYAPSARWEAIAALKQHVQGIPVLGNGDIWTASDAVRMVHETGCDGVVIGRGCLGKPWLFRDLIDAFSAGVPQPAPLLGDVLDVMLRHAESLMQHHLANGRNDEGKGIREFRKHCGWYLTGYPVGPEVRRRFAEVSTLDEVRQLATTLDRTLQLVDGGERLARG